MSDTASINNLIIPGFDGDTTEGLKISLQISKEEADVIIINLNGYIDTYNSANFQKKVEKIIHENFTKIIFECRHLRYISSTAIGVFASILNLLESKEGDFVLTYVSEKVLEILKILGFDNFFRIRPTIAEAHNHLRNLRQKSSSSSHQADYPVDNLVFPVSFKCPICSRNLRVQKAGKYKCSSCKTALRVTESASVSLA